jgi:hypothetical protein
MADPRVVLTKATESSTSTTRPFHKVPAISALDHLAPSLRLTTSFDHRCLSNLRAGWKSARDRSSSTWAPGRESSHNC